MIRAKTSQLINSILDNNKYFNFNDFKIEERGESPHSTKLKITYEYDPQFFIELSLPKEKSTFSTEETIGNIIGSSTTKRTEYLAYKSLFEKSESR